MAIDQRWAALAVNTCVAHGVDHFFLAPGSRCTPLTLAVAQHGDASVVQHLDERGLAFAALGYARSTGRPGVFICTSGTAVANAYPAVIEARMEAVPMLLFTADRPSELRGTGANQTIDQQQIFGRYPRWFFDVPCPDEQLDEDFIRDQVERAIQASASGPAHLNWMFREPFGLEPDPPRTITTASEQQSLEEVKAPRLRIAGNTLVIVGGCSAEEANAARSFASRIQAPLLSDITSGVRAIVPDVVSAGELPKPDTVVHLGGRIVSKRWLQYTGDLPATRFLHLTSQDVQINPNHLPIDRFVGPLKHLLTNVESDGNSSSGFRNAWESAAENRSAAVARVIQARGAELSDPSLAFHLGRWLPAGHGLFLGNSSPIRDMDWFSEWPDDRTVVVSANRGASGIDGVLATAVGFTTGLRRPATLLIGDLSVLHDLNSLALAATTQCPLTIVVVNNQGGGIFDMLPIAAHENFEQYFATPHEWTFEHACVMFGIEYRDAVDLPQLRSEYLAAVDLGRPALIEARTDRTTNQRVRELIATEVGKWHAR